MVSKTHTADYVLFTGNLFDDLSLDEVALCNGELYTPLTPKKQKAKKESIIIVRNQI